jgi:hypothetical protein
MVQVSSKLDALAYLFAPLLLEGHYEQRARERDLANLRKRAAKFGLTLVESPA